jgi:hypothetical protein
VNYVDVLGRSNVLPLVVAANIIVREISSFRVFLLRHRTSGIRPSAGRAAMFPINKSETGVPQVFPMPVSNLDTSSL